MTDKELNRSYRIIEIVAVIVVYVATARVGQIFAIEPGNITPVWIPSGIMLAWVLLRGYRIWPGIFFGAFFGNSWAYLGSASSSELLGALFAGVFNGFGDSLCVVASAMLILKYANGKNVFENLRAYMGFTIFGVVLGPLISALFGVTSLVLFGILDGEVYWLSLLTWWIGDGVGVLMLTPLILAFSYPEHDLSERPASVELVLFYLAALTYIVVVLGIRPSNFLLVNSPYLFFPLLLWAITRFGSRVSLLLACTIIVCHVVLEYAGVGPFHEGDSFYRAMSLQFFVLVTIFSIYLVSALVADRDRSYRLLQDEHRHDPLTGIYNRQYFDERLSQEIARQRRYKQPFSIIMYDIDFFKKVNDKYGHQVGDKVLQKLTCLVRMQVRDIDVLARWGGEEFMVLMPETDTKGAELFAERIRREVEQAELIADEKITISLGVVQASPDKEVDLPSLIGCLDAALYAAKNGGRNQVRVAEEIPESSA